MFTRPAKRLASRLPCRRPTPIQNQQRPFSTTRLVLNANPPSATSQRSKSLDIYIATLFAGAASFFLGYSLSQTPPTRCDAPDTIQLSNDSLPSFRISDVRKHDSQSDSPWVIYRDKVYDITNWIEAHPGGEVILRAAGGSIDPYWDIFTIHKNDYVYEILQQYLIGYVDSADLVNGLPAKEEIEDPFANDPERHPDLITMTAKPRNAETPGSALASDFLTPNKLFYVRNHMWVPTVSDTPDNHTLTVELADGTTKDYTLHDLKSRFPTRKVTAALQCSGNRRRHMSESSGRKANGLPWNVGAISNACWEGVYLSEILADAGLDLPSAMAGESEVKHVQFAGLEAYGASIPIKKAIDPQGDVLLAFNMNGEPLPRDHGFPLRAIVPGHVAARSVKWLNHISLSDEESTSQWQRRDYKCFGPNQTDVDWDTAPAIQELPVQSAITECKLGEWVKPQFTNSAQSTTDSPQPLVKETSLNGYAYSGGGRSIVRVDVSHNNGKTWSQAEILPDCSTTDGSPTPCFGHASWAWKRWRFNGTVPLEQEEETLEDGQKKKKLCATFVVKATDEAYNTQPESHAATWNLRGNLATAWHRMRVCTECQDDSRGNSEPSKE